MPNKAVVPPRPKKLAVDVELNLPNGLEINASLNLGDLIPDEILEQEPDHIPKDEDEEPVVKPVKKKKGTK